MYYRAFRPCDGPVLVPFSRKNGYMSKLVFAEEKIVHSGRKLYINVFFTKKIAI